MRPTAGCSRGCSRSSPTTGTPPPAIIKFIGDKEGGADKLKGKKIVLLYHDSAYGKEPHPVLEAEADEARLRTEA